MRLLKKTTVIIIALSFLLAFSIPGLALAGDFKMAAKSARVTTLPGEGSNLTTLNKYEAVIAIEQLEKHTQINANGIIGYVESSVLRDINSSVIIKGIGVANMPLSINGYAIGKGGYVQILGFTDNEAIIKYGSHVAAVPVKNITTFTPVSKPIGEVIFSKTAKAYNSALNGEKKLFDIATGEILSLLHTNDTQAIVLKNGRVGIADKTNAFIIDGKAKATGEATLKKAAYIYSGPGSKYTKKLKAAAGTTLETYGIYGRYTLVSLENTFGLIESKLLSGPIDNQKKDAQPITSNYVLALKDSHIYARPQEGVTSEAIKKGDIFEYVSTEADGLWVKVMFKGSRIGYIKRENAANYTPSQSEGQTELPAIKYEKFALEFIDVMNGLRTADGKQPLKIDDILMRCAYVRAQELTRYFSHTRPNGLMPNSLHISITGEIMGRSSVRLAPDAATIGKYFMDSPRHKAIALSGGYTKTGAAALTVDGIIYFVQLFG